MSELQPLQPLIDTYDNTLRLRVDAVRSQASNALNQVIGRVSSGYASAEAYLADKPVDSYVDGTEYRSLVQTLHDEVVKLSTSVYNEVGQSLQTRLTNSQIDFGVAVDQDNKAFSKGLTGTSADIEEATIAVQEKYSAAVGDVNTILSDTMAKLSAAITSDSERIEQLFSDKILSRPVLRPTGNRKFPSPLILDGFNDVSIELQNIGSSPWTGWMGVKITDEYKKVVTDNSVDNVTTIGPGEAYTLTKRIKVPKVMVVNGQNRSFGKKPKIVAIINTRK